MEKTIEPSNRIEHLVLMYDAALIECRKLKASAVLHVLEYIQNHFQDIFGDKADFIFEQHTNCANILNKSQVNEDDFRQVFMLLKPLDDFWMKIQASSTWRSESAYTFTKDYLLEHKQFLKEARLTGQGHHIILAALVKSGSTFLTNLLIELTKYDLQYFIYDLGRTVWDIYLPSMIMYKNVNTLTKTHAKATPGNLEILNLFSIKPIVLTRSIFDVVLSMYDHFHKPNGTSGSANFLADDFFELDQETKLDGVIDTAMPQYFAFFASWFDAVQKDDLEILWLTYEEMIPNKKETVNRVLGHLGIRKTDAEIEMAIQKVDQKKKETLFNKGIVGRGEKELSQLQKRRIVSYARYYPRVDFTKFGLTEEIIKQYS
ncbi:MAG: sulfotransferase domain-containing protein [Anaerolineaceae bacterium]|nr:sulfotransferase domain-containing protein [Anaerolineaceae bacterium]